MNEKKEQTIQALNRVIKLVEDGVFFDINSLNISTHTNSNGFEVLNVEIEINGVIPNLWEIFPKSV